MVLVQFGGVLDTQLLGQRQKQRIGIKVGIGQIGRHPAIVQRLQQAATEQGLAGADFAADLDEALALVERQQQGIERLLMVLDEVGKTGIRRDAERQLGQAKVFQIQRQLRFFTGTDHGRAGCASAGRVAARGSASRRDRPSSSTRCG
jgi:hypothetical protein